MKASKNNKKVKVLLILVLTSLLLTSTLSVYAETTTNTCRLINKSVNLSKNINSTASCLRINRSDIIVNCKGFAINYSRSSTGYAVNITGFSNVTIHNCTLQEGTATANGHGVFMQSTKENNISNLNITLLGTDAYGIIITGNSNYSQITSNIIRTTGTSGYGIYINKSSLLNNISSNSINTTGTAAHGIFIEHQSNNNSISSNFVNTSGTSSYPLYLFNASNTTVALTTINNTGTTSYGLFLNNSAENNNITQNNITVIGTNSHGMLINDSNYTLISVNNFFSADKAVVMADSAENNLTFNNLTIKGNVGGNALLFLTSNFTQVERNNITVLGNNSEGYSLASSTVSNTFLNNTVVVVSNFTNALSIGNSVSALINANNITLIGNNSDAIDMHANNKSIITKNNITVQGINGKGIFLSSNSQSINVSWNNVTTIGNGTIGLLTSGLSHSTLHENTITTEHAFAHGIALIATSKNNTITKNNITTLGAGVIGGSGIALQDSPAANLTKNLITTFNNTGYGIMLRNASDINITSTTITTRGNFSSGILINASSNTSVHLANITTIGTNSSGIHITGNAGNNTIKNSTITSSLGLEIKDDTGTGFTNTLWYNNTFGFINWSKTNLTTNISLVLGTNIFLESNHIGTTNSSQLLTLNGSAQIEIRNLPPTTFTSIGLAKNGVRCDDIPSRCNMTYNAATNLLQANISGFSSYRGIETATGQQSQGGSGSSETISTQTTESTTSSESTSETTSTEASAEAAATEAAEAVVTEAVATLAAIAPVIALTPAAASVDAEAAGEAGTAGESSTSSKGSARGRSKGGKKKPLRTLIKEQGVKATVQHAIQGNLPVKSFALGVSVTVGISFFAGTLLFMMLEQTGSILGLQQAQGGLQKMIGFLFALPMAGQREFEELIHKGDVRNYLSIAVPEKTYKIHKRTFTNLKPIKLSQEQKIKAVHMSARYNISKDLAQLIVGSHKLRFRDYLFSIPFLQFPEPVMRRIITKETIPQELMDKYPLDYRHPDGTQKVKKTLEKPTLRNIKVYVANLVRRNKQKVEGKEEQKHKLNKKSSFMQRVRQTLKKKEDYNPHLLLYIQNSLHFGHPVSRIHNVLKKHGWKKKHIQRHIKHIKKKGYNKKRK